MITIEYKNSHSLLVSLLQEHKHSTVGARRTFCRGREGGGGEPQMCKAKKDPHEETEVPIRRTSYRIFPLVSAYKLTV